MRLAAFWICTALLVCAFAAPADALEQTLVAADGQASDYFGSAVAVDGDTAVVGAPENSGQPGPGFVYVFKRDGDVWKQTARLQGSDTRSGDEFGLTVAISGNDIVVGAPMQGAGTAQRDGAVYVFTRNGLPNRTEALKLTVPSASATDGLGSGVAVDGAVIAACAPGDGAVYLFDATTGAQRARLTTKDGATGLCTGASIAMDGNLVVASDYIAPFNGNSDGGAAYTFDASSTGAGTSTDKLVASDESALDQFGFSVDVQGDTIVVGALQDSFPGRSYVGSAYTFASTGDHEQTGKLVSSDGMSADRFGWSVAIGSQIAVGADGHDLHTGAFSSDEGSVYLFPRSSPLDDRTEDVIQNAPSPADGDSFGSSVAMDGTTLVVGSRDRTVGGNYAQGSAEIYYAQATAPACSDGADNDGDGKIDFPADPGCDSATDTSEVDPPPGATPTPTLAPGVTPTPTTSATPVPGGSGTLPPDQGDDGSQLPRIVRPGLQPPVTPSGHRTIKLIGVWNCTQPAGVACDASAFVTVAYSTFTDDRRATLAAKHKRVTIGSSHVTVPNGASKHVTARLSKKGLKLLRRRGKLKAQVATTLNRAGASPARATIRVTIKRPKPAAASALSEAREGDVPGPAL